jgi:hypothetical protein
MAGVQTRVALHRELLAQARDVVELDIDRQRLGIGADLAGGQFVIAPLQRGISYRQAKAREIVGIWHANKQTRARKDSRAA